jgi:TRAP-type C4-dicarboxylate transport system permease small subunit
MAGLYRRAMDYLYLLCVAVGGAALVLISAVIPWAVFTRYVLNSAASWPEPFAILLTIVLTFIGAAAAYRLNLHMNVSYFADQLPQPWRKWLDLVVQLLMALIAIFMIVWGERLVEVTWHNTIPDFPFLSVGITYLPIPVGGVCLLLFIVERIFLGLPPDPIPQHPHAAPFE